MSFIQRRDGLDAYYQAPITDDAITRKWTPGRNRCAMILRHCRREGGSAYLRDEEAWEDAGAYLAEMGFGTLAPSRVAGRGHIFTLTRGRRPS